MNTTDRPAPPSFWEAFRFWLKLGFISFGGPAGQISVMHQELVERRRWISERRFLHALNYCMVLPGPEAQQLATYIGWLLHRTWGGIVAGALFVLPSLAILIALSWLYLVYGHTPLVAGLFYGIKPAVTAIVLHAAHRIGSRALKTWPLWAIAACSFLATAALAIPFPAIVLAAALLGAAGGRWWPDNFNRPAPQHGVAPMHGGPAVIDDDTPRPAHAAHRWRHFFWLLAAGVALWALVMLATRLAGSAGERLAEMGLFFTKAALMTFGGAYAVLPYVVQGAVTQFGWLSGPQMIDGLALGESTPGPLIMVVAFVGFLGGWNQQLLGADNLLAAGMLAAALVTFFTFLPSFIFILMGGPLVESTRADIRFTAPLTAITAAVVGVILNLALFFAHHVMWPQGLAGGIDWISLALTLAAGFALFAMKRTVIEVICASAAMGLLIAGTRMLFN